MAKNLFGDLGSILGGLAKSVVPKDTPEGKLLNAQSDLSDLQKQETELLIEIGREAYKQNPSAWSQHEKLQVIQQNIADAQKILDEAKAEQEKADAEKAAEDAKGRCPECGYKNSDGMKFCQECGTSLIPAGPKLCSSCGAELTSGSRFCGECGARQEGV